MSETRLKLGDKEFVLKPLTIGDFSKLEEMGVDIMGGKQTLNIQGIQKLIFVALNKADTEVTMEWVGDNISLTEDKEAIETITNFINATESSAEPTT